MRLRLWVDIAEIAASIAVVLSLLLLVFQIRESDEIERVQNSVRMAQWDAQMFLLSDRLPAIAAKIEAIKNPDFMQPFREQFELSIEEAGIWNRWLYLVWKGFEAEYLLTGPSDHLAEQIRYSANYEDQRLAIIPIFYPGNPNFDAGFIEYVIGLIGDPSKS